MSFKMKRTLKHTSRRYRLLYFTIHAFSFLVIPRQTPTRGRGTNKVIRENVLARYLLTINRRYYRYLFPRVTTRCHQLSPRNNAVRTYKIVLNWRIYKHMLAQGAYSVAATSLEIIDNGRKIKTVLAFGIQWSNQNDPKARKYGDTCFTLIINRI